MFNSKLNFNQIYCFRNATTKQRFPFLIPDEKNFLCGGGGGDPVLKRGLSTFILGARRKFKINNEACTSFKIEKIKLPLTMSHPRADLLPQMPHPGEDKAVNSRQMPECGVMGGGGGGGMSAVGIDGAIKECGGHGQRHRLMTRSFEV